MNSNKTIGEKIMSHYGELEEVTGIPYVKFIKVDGNWYMEEDEEGNVVTIRSGNMVVLIEEAQYHQKDSWFK